MKKPKLITPPHASGHKAARGYTLVEVLVVIAIIIVLGALVMVVARKGNEGAKSASTLNRLREIGGATGSYMSDHGMFFPPAWDNTEGRNRSYAQLLDEYMHGRTPYRESDSKFIGPNARLKVKVNKWSHPITFSMNRAIGRDVTERDGVAEQAVHITRVERLSDVILFGDGCQRGKLNQANATAHRVFRQVGETGPMSDFSEPIPVGLDEDSSDGDGWFRYPYGKCHTLMCDGSARVFSKGSIQKGNVWIDRASR